MRNDLIGGAVVRRRFRLGARELMAGNTLLAAEVLAIPENNRRALIDSRWLETWPAPPPAQGERFVVPCGKGLFHVVEGRRITAEPLSIEEAKDLAAEAS